jgi:two-component system sensor histidine kinase/response regulator
VITPDNKARILIVDDEPRNVRLLQGILYAEPYQLFSAYTGSEALAAIRQTPPDLILLDIMMPGMSGYDLCWEIKNTPEYRMIPIVMVTALHEVGDRVKALEAGADDFLSKPVDATELIVRVRTLLRLRQLYTQIEQITAERLRFMAGVAHDIRSPLNALSLTLELIAEKLPSDGTFDKLWARVMLCLERIQGLANDVMNYYKIESGQIELTLRESWVREVVEDALTIAEQVAVEKQIQLISNPISDIVISIDKEAIVQVLLNLLTNAIKYTPAGGTVALSVYDLREDSYSLPVNHYPPMIALPVDCVVFEIRDTGSGIGPEESDRVFGEFARLKAARDTETEGIGLGLAVSRRLVRLHGGDIWFTSIVNEGSTFAFFLPRQQQPPV